MSGQESDLDNSVVLQEQDATADVGKKGNASGNVKPYSNRWLAKVYDEKPPFPENVLNTVFAPERVTTIVKALKEATAKEVEESNRLLEDNFTYSLQISSFKIPHVNVHLSRILLKHSLLNDDSEICLFVKDLKRGRRLDFEPTIQHYEKILRANKIKHSITVIPINQLYNEYASFELRRKLTFAYDKFLAEGSIAAHVNGFLGTKMLNKGRIAFPVNLGAKDLAGEIDIALRKVCYKHMNRGVTQSIQCGKHSMSDEAIAENVIDLVKKIGEIHPGGYENVHKLHLKPQHNLSVVIPIYVSLDRPKDGVPTETSNKDALLEQQSAKAAEILEKFDISAAAKLIQRRRLPLNSISIVDEDHLLSDDESTPAEQPPRPKRERLGNFGGEGARRGRFGSASAPRGAGNNATKPAAAVAKPAATAAPARQTATKPSPATKTSTPARQANAVQPAANRGAGPRTGGRPVRRPINNNANNNANTSNNANVGVNRSARKLNGVSNASRGAISRQQKRQSQNLTANLNRAIVQNLLRSNDNNGDNFSPRNNDLIGSSFNNRSGGGGGNDSFDRGLDFRRGNDNFDLDYTRRSSGNDFNRGGGASSFPSLNLGSSWGPNSGGGGGGGNASFGRGFNNGNRF